MYIIQYYQNKKWCTILTDDGQQERVFKNTSVVKKVAEVLAKSKRCEVKILDANNHVVNAYDERGQELPPDSYDSEF